MAKREIKRPNETAVIKRMETYENMMRKAMGLEKVLPMATLDQMSVEFWERVRLVDSPDDTLQKHVGTIDYPDDMPMSTRGGFTQHRLLILKRAMCGILLGLELTESQQRAMENHPAMRPSKNAIKAWRKGIATRDSLKQRLSMLGIDGELLHAAYLAKIG